MNREIDFQAAERETGNLCLTYCKAACCSNATLVGVSKEQFDKFSEAAPVIKQVGNKDSVWDIVYQTSYLNDGVYFAVGKDGKYTVGIKGKCPNLMPDNRCGIYEERPDACRNFAVGSKDCDSARRKIGLKPLSQIIPVSALRRI